MVVQYYNGQLCKSKCQGNSAMKEIRWNITYSKKIIFNSYELLKSITKVKIKWNG